MELKHVATREGRLSSFLKGEMKMSSGLMNRLKWGDSIQVNGISQHTDYPVKPEDVITVMLDEEPVEYPAEEGELTILYEDDHLLAVDKPAGMLIHPSRSKNEGTLANYVAGYYVRSGQKSAFHPVTRLDRDTFGVVLLAKNSHMHALLQTVDLNKTYHALVYGGPQEDHGFIDAPIDRQPLPSLLRFVGPKGKPSQTEFSVLRRMGGYAELALCPITGRTHQLRVHCSYMGYPILGDPQYASVQSEALSSQMGLKHQLLQAYSLEFVHPITEQLLRIESKMRIMKEPMECELHPIC